MGGYHTVTAGQTITAANHNTYIRDQTINQFASASARDAAITSPAEGMWADLADVDALVRYSGSAWGLGFVGQSGFNFLRRSSDASGVLSNTTLADDSVFAFTVPANATFLVLSQVRYTAGTTGDLKVGWSGPASATFDWGLHGAASTVASNTDSIYHSPNTTGIGGTDAAGGQNSTEMMCRPQGVLITAGTSGTFRFRWAQQTSDGGFATTVKAGSWMLVARMA